MRSVSFLFWVETFICPPNRNALFSNKRGIFVIYGNGFYSFVPCNPFCSRSCL